MPWKCNVHCAEFATSAPWAYLYRMHLRERCRRLLGDIHDSCKVAFYLLEQTSPTFSRPCLSLSHLMFAGCLSAPVFFGFLFKLAMKQHWPNSRFTQCTSESVSLPQSWQYWLINWCFPPLVENMIQYRTKIVLSAMQLATDIHGPKTMNPNNFVNPLTYNLMLPTGQNVDLSNT